MRHPLVASVPRLPCFSGRLLVLLIPLIALIPAPLAAEDLRVQAEVESLLHLLRRDEGSMDSTSAFRATVDLRSPPGQAVEGRIQLRFTLHDEQREEQNGEASTDQVLTELLRGYTRFRLPLGEKTTLRITSGKDRLTWGAGALLNAGDLIFGADGTALVDLTTLGALRDETAWLTAVFLPLGDLAYLEAAVLPPLEHSPGEHLPSRQGPEQTRAGFRLYRAGERLSLETSLLYQGEREETTAAVTIQSGAGSLDLYAAGQVTLEDRPDETLRHGLEERSLMTLGSLWHLSPGFNRSLTLRVEALLFPGGAWTRAEDPQTASYGIFLYPELRFSPNRSLELVSRSMISPVDSSAHLSGGVSWTIQSGLHLQAFAGVQAGSSASRYNQDQEGSLWFSAGCLYRF
ncbi:hypothetical protein AU468_10305 [Alkalispirochaeta sphaeroplastigenens]|uniref:Alginate export domain-containing protein n=1 Tax=Alkalispirochaeta sphaeroplastigenens TaxID=1187066 RepID=A0A2S4JJM5_9SPIO|nr:hypothetical protein [Alkalispirochaeta sphaeroplastigenens]POQ99691.1 hypothetical protein AU468_10305 [Alkalispirochaeta sphaeroplastigenens]